MATSNFIPEIWSRELLYSLKKNLVGNSIVNRNYQGEITSEGDKVNIQTPNAINTGTYTGAEIEFQTLTSGTQKLEIDQAKYFAFLVDDVDQAQANVPLMQSYMVEASFSLGDVADQAILSLVTDADSDNVLTAALTKDNIYAEIVKAKKNLSLQNVPGMGRWMVVSPEEVSLLEQSTEFTAASNLGDQIKRTGFVGRIAGIEVFESNNVLQVGNMRNLPYGYTGSITFADQIVSTEAGRREKGFSDFVKGLHVYGLKTVRPKSLGNLRNQLAS